MDASALSSAEYWLSWIGIAKLAAAALVAAGVVLEFGSEWLSRPFEATVKHAREVQVAALERDAETARSEIATANESAAAAREQAARLEKEAEVARSQIADATKAAAIANERAANLEREAAAANERAAAIMQATAWRQFSPDQFSKISAELVPKSGKLELAWIANDAESLSLAIGFSNIFENHKEWNLLPSAKTYATRLMWGIHIPDVVGAADTVALLRKAFTDAGVSFSTEPLPREDMSFGGMGSPEPDRAIILFGSKKPTFAQPPG